MAIELNWEDAGTLTVLSGEITFAQMTDLLYKIINDPRYENVQYSIYCYQPEARIVFADVDYKMVAHFEQESKNLERKIIWAIVTTDQVIIRQLVNMSFNTPMKICESLEQARAYVHRILHAKPSDLDPTEQLLRREMGLGDPQKELN